MDPTSSTSYGLFLVTILTGSYIVKTLFVQYYFHMVFRTGMHVRPLLLLQVFFKSSSSLQVFLLAETDFDVRNRFKTDSIVRRDDSLQQGAAIVTLIEEGAFFGTNG